MLKYIHRSSVDGLYAIQHEYIPCLYCIIESTSIPVRLMLDDYYGVMGIDYSNLYIKYELMGG